MSETIRVNFGRPVPLFPLPDTVLLPHAILPLHIFEPRYRQMVSDCLDQSGQLAIGTFGCPQPKIEESPSGERSVTIRAAVCIGQIIQHDALDGGNYNILMHGVCRAKIEDVLEPSGARAYRMAKLSPLEQLDHDPEPMPEVREELRELLAGPRLRRLRAIETFQKWVDQDEVPTHALLELIGFGLIRDTELKYRLLAEPDPLHRAGLIVHELRHLDTLVRRGDVQPWRQWPKGMSWN